VHEMAITQSVVDAVSERMPDATVRRIRLQIGRLSGVVADSVRFCFDVVAEDTPLDGAVLEIIESSGRARCRSCGDEFETNDLLALCGCGEADLELLAGEELLIKEVEVAA
jgi:hydrogenase nickel incorporation protein HypA/HybF